MKHKPFNLLVALWFCGGYASLAYQTPTPDPSPTPDQSSCCPAGMHLVPSLITDNNVNAGLMIGPEIGIDYCTIWAPDSLDSSVMKILVADRTADDIDECVSNTDPNVYHLNESGDDLQYTWTGGVKDPTDARNCIVSAPLPGSPGACDPYNITVSVLDVGLCNVSDGGAKTDSTTITVCRPKAEWDCDEVTSAMTSSSLYYNNRHFFKYTVDCPVPLDRLGTEGLNVVYHQLIYSATTIYKDEYSLGDHLYASGNYLGIYAIGDCSSNGDVGWQDVFEVGTPAIDFGSLPSVLLHHKYTATIVQQLYYGGSATIYASGVLCQEPETYTLTMRWDTDSQRQIIEESVQIEFTKE
ncbi:MAG: hypothetical protein ABI579_02375 [Candidatus Sumerlaeota bacterium]